MSDAKLANLAVADIADGSNIRLDLVEIQSLAPSLLQGIDPETLATGDYLILDAAGACIVKARDLSALIESRPSMVHIVRIPAGIPT